MRFDEIIGTDHIIAYHFPMTTTSLRIDINDLNSRLRSQAQGSILKIANTSINSTMAGSLFVSTEIPANVDLEFENVEFFGDHFFRQAYAGRLVFMNCKFRGRRIEFTKCKRGFVTFLGKTDLASGFSFEECEDISLSLSGANSTFEVHPDWQMPGVPIENIAKSMNISINRSSGSFSIKSFSHPIVFQVWNSNLMNIDLDCDDIRLFQLLATQVDRLAIEWKILRRLDCGSGEIKYLQIDFKKLLNLAPYLMGPRSDGIDSATLESLAKIYRRNGEVDKFVSLFAKAGTARYESYFYESRKHFETERANGASSWKKVAAFKITKISGLISDLIVNKWLKRFFSPLPIFITQLAAIFIFAAVYFVFKENLVTSAQQVPIQSFREAAYFSSVTFLTIGYGDILPTGWLQIVAAIEGFSGLILGLVLAVVASRRYSS